METIQCSNRNEVEKLVLTKKGGLNTNSLKQSYWDRRNKTFLYLEILEATKNLPGISLSERIFLFLGNNQKTCLTCDKNKTIFFNFKNGYSDYCSKYCSQKSPIRTEKIKKKLAENKVSHAEKIKQGVLRNHGVDNFSKTDEFKEKYKSTMNDRYGVDNAFQLEEVQRKSRLTKIQKYGINNLLGNAPKDKVIKTNRERYGYDYFFQSENGKFTKKTLKEHYGYTEEEILAFFKSKDSTSIEWALRKTDGNFENAKRLHEKRISDCNITRGKASKESLRIFEPLTKWLLEVGFLESQIFYGSGKHQERFLYDDVLRKVYFYDYSVFTEKSKVIIEFHGVKFHPKENEIHSFIPIFETSKSPLELFEKDQSKKICALRNGYHYLELWSDEDNKLNKAKEFLTCHLKEIGKC